MSEIDLGYFEQMREERNLAIDMLAALKHTIVATIGGVDYEGNPTSEINYLQRLRILVEKEKHFNVVDDNRAEWKARCSAFELSRSHWKSAARMIHDENCQNPNCLKIFERQDPVKDS